MQARKNKYQRDKRGHIIEEPKEKEDNKGKGKLKEEAVMSKNKFEALEVEEDAQPILTITDGNVDGKDKNERKDQGGKGTSKMQQQENKKKERDQSPNPTPNGTRGGDSRKLSGKEGGTSTLKKEEFDARRVKKEAVEKANKEGEVVLQMKKLNPTSGGVQSSLMGALVPSNTPIPIDSRIDVDAKKENTIDWVHRTFGTNKEELRQCNVTTNQSCQEIPSQTYDDAGQLEDRNEVSSRNVLWSNEVEVMEAKMGSKIPTEGKENRGNMQLQKTIKLDDATVNPSSSTARVEDRGTSIEDQVNVSAGGDHDGVPVYALMKEQVGNVPKNVVKDTVCQNQQTDNGKGSDLNGTVTQAVSASFATVNPNLSSVYELQFKMMQEKLGDMVSNSDHYDAALTPHEPGEQAIVSGESEALPIACSSGTGSPL
ncbi:hypothetical protein A4A49_37543 [Nicotiana attenuata]|uniref:Uncharacterized protein n=1 Tax=Nicotiana attenuata TaxID=49451 RepID=A0A1J6JUB6_NICAT|nr:hypothetical protein A4A49_37543 [Nicotiana attenuata]